MPARCLPRTPRPRVRLECVWEGCANAVDWQWHRNKWMARLYCTRHKRLNARLNNLVRKCTAVELPIVGYRDGQRLVRVAHGRYRPWNVVRYEQLLGRRLEDEWVDWVPVYRESLARLRIRSMACHRLRWGFAATLRETGAYVRP